MALTGKILAQGQLPSAKNTLYTVPALTQADVLLIVVVANAAGNKLNLYVKKSGGTSRLISELAQSVDGLARFSGPYTLSAGDVIEGDDNGGSGAVFDYSIFGNEIT